MYLYKPPTGLFVNLPRCVHCNPVRSIHVNGNWLPATFLTCKYLLCGVKGLSYLQRRNMKNGLKRHLPFGSFQSDSCQKQGPLREQVNQLAWAGHRSSLLGYWEMTIQIASKSVLTKLIHSCHSIAHWDTSRCKYKMQTSSNRSAGLCVIMTVTQTFFRPELNILKLFYICRTLLNCPTKAVIMWRLNIP